MMPQTIYKTYLTVSLISVNIQVRLYSYHNIEAIYRANLIPLELIKNEISINRNNFDQLWAVLIPKIQNFKKFNKKIELLLSLGVHLIIVEEHLYDFDSSKPVFAIRSIDYRYIIGMMKNELVNNKFKNVKDNYVPYLQISKNYNDSLHLIDEFFLQIPPILLIILIVIIWKTFASEDEYLDRNIYNYEDIEVNDTNFDERNVCCICYEEYKIGETIRKLNCLHLFHKRCISYWLGRNNVCPVCRKDVYRSYGFLESEITFL
ncbi:hypothetical protein GVAV_002315 [Gurleya vavrai]